MATNKTPVRLQTYWRNLMGKKRHSWQMESMTGQTSMKAVQRHSSDAIIIIPPRKDAVFSGNPMESKTQRNNHLKHIQDEGRYKWKRSSGYYNQSQEENAFGRFKHIFGGR